MRVFLYPVRVMSGVCAPVSYSDVYVYAPTCVCERMRACRRKGRAPFHQDARRELFAPAPIRPFPAIDTKEKLSIYIYIYIYI